MRIAVVGSGISGLSAAWLLSRAHEVTLHEQAARLGGHSNTVDVPGSAGTQPVDMGFIVYNPITYPNLCALLEHLGVGSSASNMSFSVSLGAGALEYAGNSLSSLFAQRSNLLRPRFWSMLKDLRRFYASARSAVLNSEMDYLPLREYLRRGRYGRAFVEDHLLPMAAAIWSCPTQQAGNHPTASFIRFFDNHGLLLLRGRPQWRTVAGGSRQYVNALARCLQRVRAGCTVRSVRRENARVVLRDGEGQEQFYDHVVLATHSDDALSLLDQPSEREQALLGAIGYRDNLAVMHTDVHLMPRRRAVWSSWNYIQREDESPCVSYWMNRLQNLDSQPGIFVTVGEAPAPRPQTVIHRESYRHPQFDAEAIKAQRELWSLQGSRRTWFCGAYFGAGFHEDGLQAGLAVAEELGGVRRPWTLPAPSSRIHAGTSAQWSLAAC